MADRPHVLALIPLPPVARESLAAHYELHLAPNGPESIGSEVPLEKIAAVATNGTTGLGPQLMDRMPNLRVVSTFGVGHENVDLSAAKARGVTVCGTASMGGSTPFWSAAPRARTA